MTVTTAEPTQSKDAAAVDGPPLQYKSATMIPVEVDGQPAFDDESGIVRAIVNVTGIVDHDGDIIEPGAHADSLKARIPRGCTNHDMTKRVAVTRKSEEWMPGDPRLPAEIADGVPWPAEAGALYVEAKYILGSTAGRDAYETVKELSQAGQCEWSIGYATKPGKAVRGKDGVRRIKRGGLDVFEYSDVIFGASPGTRSVEVKAEKPPAGGDPVLPGEETEEPPAAPQDEPPAGPGVLDVASLDEELAGLSEEELADLRADAATAVPDAPTQDDTGEPDDTDDDTDAAPPEPGDPGTEADAEAATDPAAPAGQDTAGTKTAAGGITTVDGLRKAIAAANAEKDPIKRNSMRMAAAAAARRLGQPDLIPADWGKTAAGAKTADTTGVDVDSLVDRVLVEIKRRFTAEQRQHAADAGHAMADGSYPITDEASLRDAIRAVGRGGADHDKIRKHVMKRARALGHADLIPDTWNPDGSIKDTAGKALAAGALQIKYDTSPVGTEGGRRNWVDSAGGLPAFIRAVAHALLRAGHSETNAIQIAVSRMKVWAAGGGNVSKKTQAKAAAALAEWERMKASAGKADGATDGAEHKPAVPADAPDTPDAGPAAPADPHPGDAVPPPAPAPADPPQVTGTEEESGTVTVDPAEIKTLLAGLGIDFAPPTAPAAAEVAPEPAAQTKMGVPGVSYLAGSLEERLDMLRDAVRDRLRGAPIPNPDHPGDPEYYRWEWPWVSIIGTFDTGDYVIATRERYGPDDQCEVYRCSYRWNPATAAFEVTTVEQVELKVTAEPTAGSTPALPSPAAALSGLATASAGMKVWQMAADQLGPQTKAGRMLSTANATALKAAVEHLLSVLRRAGVDVGAADKPAGADAPVPAPPGTVPATKAAPTGDMVTVDPAAVADMQRILAAARGAT